MPSHIHGVALEQCRDRLPPATAASQPPQRAQPPRRPRSVPNYLKPTATSVARTASSRAESLSVTSRRTPPSSSAVEHRRRIPATDPCEVSRLWNDVMSAQPRYMQPTGSAMRRGKHAASIDEPDSATRTRPTSSRSRSVSDQTPNTAFTPPSTTSSRSVKLELVIKAYNITIDDSGIDVDVGHHFGVHSLDPCIARRIQTLPEEKQHALRNVSVWLDPYAEDDIRLIQAEYKAMNIYHMNEAEFANCALTYLFKGERRSPYFLMEQGDKCWLPDRLLQPVNRPDGERWEAPTAITGASTYSWDIRPDCAYWISLQAFDLGFRDKVYTHTTVLQDRVMCPYFTIEFKKDSDKNTAHARNQVAIASCIALYNRWRLKQLSGAEWLPDAQQRCQIRHYGLTFANSKWSVWCVTPKTFDTWTGCHMYRLYSGNCLVEKQVVQLVRWINEIHYWGLTVHGPNCKADISTRVHGTAGADAADISALTIGPE